MKISNSFIENKNEKVRITSNITYQDNLSTDNVWFELDKKYLPYLTKTVNPWLIYALPIAMKIGENIKTNSPADSLFLSNTEAIQVLKKSWNNKKRTISIETEINKLTNNSDKTACFFSGGVDSFYTVLKKYDQIDYLIFILGFDIKLDIDESYLKENIEIIKNLGKEFNKEIITIKTNLRKTRSLSYNHQLI
jgi:hypothetical protein